MLTGRTVVDIARRILAETVDPEVQLHLIRSNTSTTGLAEGRADAAIVRI